MFIEHWNVKTWKLYNNVPGRKLITINVDYYLMVIDIVVHCVLCKNKDKEGEQLTLETSL